MHRLRDCWRYGVVLAVHNAFIKSMNHIVAHESNCFVHDGTCCEYVCVPSFGGANQQVAASSIPLLVLPPRTQMLDRKISRPRTRPRQSSRFWQTRFAHPCLCCVVLAMYDMRTLFGLFSSFTHRPMFVLANLTWGAPQSVQT